MSLTDIFSDAITYPFSDITNFLIVGVLAVLASLSSVVTSFGVESTAIIALAGIIGFIFSLILSGYSVDVIKNGIDSSRAFPDIDLKENLINGIKAMIIGIVYMIIPCIIAFALLAVFGLVGAGIDHVVASLGLASIIIFIIFILFGIFEVIALARFADTKDLGDALSIGAVIEDVKKVGIINIILFLIILMIIVFIATLIISLFAFIPYIGVIIATLILGAFLVLFGNRALGLLYAGA